MQQVRFLLCQMNLLLHGVESPAIRQDSSLRVNLGESGEKDRDVILTKPPFGGEEEPGAQNGFPHDKRTVAVKGIYSRNSR